MCLPIEPNRNGLKSDTFQASLRTIYADTDSMGVVYHAKYLEYFEYARNEMLREIGYPYKMLEENGIYLPVREAHLKYLRPAFYDDLLTIRTAAYQAQNHSLHFKIACEIFRDQDHLVSGYTIHFTSNSEGRPARPPRRLYRDLHSTLFHHPNDL
ncbi:MAG: thioesterase family protein [Candidatus Caenarcaniphilales bacterium]|nr:thioesterase family protein [Candidatus Caenarcaniphilales bacterium]